LRRLGRSRKRKVDQAIAQLNRNVEAMQKQIVSMQKAARIGAPAAAAEDPSSEDNPERPLKASRLFQGKGTAARRAYSAEPQAHAPRENGESAFEHNIQGGDARKCHIVLKDPVISSRLHRGVRELLEATMPALSAIGSRFDICCRSLAAEVTFWTASECSVFVN
jgi:hypothetical protein